MRDEFYPLSGNPTTSPHGVARDQAGGASFVRPIPACADSLPVQAEPRRRRLDPANSCVLENRQAPLHLPSARLVLLGLQEIQPQALRHTAEQRPAASEEDRADDKLDTRRSNRAA